MNEALKKFFTENEIKNVLEIKKTHITHPLKELLQFDEKHNRSQADIAIIHTLQAFKNAMHYDINLLNNYKKRLIRSDFDDCASVLSELRAYNDLTMAELKPTKQKESEQKNRISVLNFKMRKYLLKFIVAK